MSDFNVAYQTVTEKLGKQSNKLTISQVEKYSNSFKIMKTSLQEHNNFIQRFEFINVKVSCDYVIYELTHNLQNNRRYRQMKKYENEYSKELELTNRDPFDISTLQTYVQKLQADIHHANEEQVSVCDFILYENY